MSTNPQLDLAFSFVLDTNQNIFLTGKAGTGKTTFLHDLRKTPLKRMAIVAPTGVAAINAGGVTIHSFFQMPFGPYVPVGNSEEMARRKFSKDRINLIKSLDLLVIDEISMVRADTLDSIDAVLRRFRKRNQPFGGVQLLMIGDLHQLSPVVKDEDWKILKDFYPNLYFFSSKALRQTSPYTIELKHIYRQTDTTFIDLLNNVRENRLNSAVLSQLNERYIADFKPGDDEGYITLTTHNQTAQQINDTHQEKIPEKPAIFNATIQGEFPEYAYPTETELQVKVGAQVMFVKNDPSRDKLFYNGKIGRVTAIQDDAIYVKCPSDLIEIAVSPLEWTNIKFELNPETKEIEEKVIGSFIQYPLKLAWAITIHKSQGLTFDKAIIDAQSAFAHGQVYVALSRCKSFEGLVLRTPLSLNSVKTDGTVAEYTRHANENIPGEHQLTAAKKSFQQDLLFDLFDFSNTKSLLYYLKKHSEDHHSALAPELSDDIAAIQKTAETEIYSVAENFKKQLTCLLIADVLPEENGPLQERVKKACTYFIGKAEELKASIDKLNLETDNKAVKNDLNEVTNNLQKESFIKTAGLKGCISGFRTLQYLQTKANAEIDFTEAQTKAPALPKVSEKIDHPPLYLKIKTWRDQLAGENNVPGYHVLPQKTLADILRLLPSTPDELASIKGIGKIKVQRYGAEILEMINHFCEDNNIRRHSFQLTIKQPKVKVDTKKVSLDLYKEGKAVSEIAAIRGLTTGTVEGHLAHYIISGEIAIFDIVPKIKVAKIMAYIVQNPDQTTSETKAALGEDISYSDIKAVMNHLSYLSPERLEA
ncbi:MAG TPA: helix-turn-helix domain-containing protein [Sphingobacteriaceae bacterium]